MANIVIRDLNEDKELDKQAMSSLFGGRLNLRTFSGLRESRALHPSDVYTVYVDGVYRGSGFYSERLRGWVIS